MSGPYGPECDELLLRQRLQHRRELRDSFTGSLIIVNACWAALVAVYFIDGWLFWPTLAGAICIWSSATVVAFSIWLHA